MHEPGRQDGHDGPASVGRRAAGALEGEVLGILRAADCALTPGEVRLRITATQARELSYSTIVTIMSRLYDKGLLARQRSGRGFAYAVVDEASLAASRMTTALGSGNDRSAVLSRFVSGLSGRDARLLQSLLADARESAPDDAAEPTERS